ncbi:acyl-protein thioesterase 1 [Clohesyomyces aquaticus]|uniref:Acyl-protein thioesterase 1 n=1 Tax=Clohesyomyces aquaticus TaxID=1231657 RepID=A0A1Y1ZR57_9PLEO|nr:acyl-protein thioesterase 1 [Clohesyomyces aquaticus]
MLSQERKPPVIVPALTTPDDPAQSAAFIFIHGFGDEAAGIENIPHQFQSASKLPHLSWILPNALENRAAMNTAWYMPTALPPYPPSRPELEDDEDEEGMKTSMAYIVSLIDNLVAKGVPEKRIVLGGFSQGCAMTLLAGLTSKYAGKLGGLVGLSGYLPLADIIPALRQEAGFTRHVDDNVEVFLARGTRDMLVPKRYFRICYETLFGLGVKENKVTVKEYEGMGHVMAGPELRDLCEWLERVVPA